MDTKLLGLILQGDKKNKQEFNRIKETYEELSNSKANTIIGSANGESIVLSDSSDSKLDNLRVFGKSEQVTTTGKNLIIDEAELIGTLANTTNGHTLYISPLTAGTYTFSMAVGGKRTDFHAAFRDNTSSVIQSGSGKTFTLSDDECSRVHHVDIYPVSAVNEQPIDYVQLELGNTATAYEPYTGGIPSPNPQYPQEIVSAGDDGNIEANVLGKNLIPFPYRSESFTSGGLTYEALPDGSIKVTGTKSNTSYFNLLGSITGDYDIENICFTKHIYASVENNFMLSARLTDGTYSNGITDSILNKAIGALYVECRCANGTTVNEIIHPIISYVDGVDYEPYIKQPLTIPTPNGLPGIKVTDPSIATYTDKAGQMWCADEVDFERGVYVKRVYEYTTTGKEGLGLASNNRYMIGYQGNKLPVCVNRYSCANCACTHFISSALESMSSKMNVAAANASNMYFRIDDNTTEEDMRAALSQGVKIQYIMATPIETPLSESELNAYKALHTNYSNTTILNDSGAHMEVKYTADKKNYIDNKFAQITNAVLSMGSNI